MWISGLLALAGFGSIVVEWSGWPKSKIKFALITALFVLFFMIIVLRPFIPPAPLSVASTQFGRSVRNLVITQPITSLPAPDSGRISVLTSIQAPMGLKEKIRHRWYVDGDLVYTSPFYAVTGGRSSGYRVWTEILWRKSFAGQKVVVNIETSGRQLIGRAVLKN
jgi:hypothetical protein